ncbi:MAG TPA: hypothetical protein DD415_04510 [Clostridiales bacterium]|nr:hypothetical protein [Clostridiales bacterium]
MRVYFLSCVTAALKLNGIYLGVINGFEKFVELDPADGIFAEVIPADELQPAGFIIDKKFLTAPPKFADVYLTEGDAIVYIKDFAFKSTRIEVIYQTRFCGNLITVFSQGETYLSAEGAEFGLIPLPQKFKAVRAEERKIGGRDVLALYGGDYLIIISDTGKVIFFNEVRRAEFDDRLRADVPFATCTAAIAQCEYGYDGETLTLLSSKTVETRPPENDVIHFAFFESVLTRGDFARYLDDELKPRADDLKSYLGEFVSVAVPPEKFYSAHGDVTAAGLVYPKAENLFEIKYFAVDISGGKISNIYPVE